MKAEQGDWVSGVELYKVEFLAEFGKKRNTDDDFPPHWNRGSENNNWKSIMRKTEFLRIN